MKRRRRKNRLRNRIFFFIRSFVRSLRECHFHQAMRCTRTLACSLNRNAWRNRRYMQMLISMINRQYINIKAKEVTKLIDAKINENPLADKVAFRRKIFKFSEIRTHTRSHMSNSLSSRSLPLRLNHTRAPPNTSKIKYNCVK